MGTKQASRAQDNMISAVVIKVLIAIALVLVIGTSVVLYNGVFYGQFKLITTAESECTYIVDASDSCPSGYYTKKFIGGYIQGGQEGITLAPRQRCCVPLTQQSTTAPTTGGAQQYQELPEESWFSAVGTCSPQLTK